MEEAHDEDITQRHKREVKELNAKIQALKHSAPKGDKKRKKQVTNEIALLQAQLEVKHEQELKEHEVSVVAAETSISGGVEKLTIKIADSDQNNEKTCEDEEKSSEHVSPHKKSKAQKRREKKEQEERERQRRLEEGEKESEHHLRNVEAKVFTKLLSDKNLRLHEVQPDGNCMFNAILYQKSPAVPESQLKDLRERTVQYMRAHKDDFLPFATGSKTGEPLTEDEFEEYCNEMQHTSAWGGHLELRAISQLYKQRVEIYQASAPPISIGEECHGSTNPPIRLSYHRHQYGLGEHYNALIPK